MNIATKVSVAAIMLVATAVMVSATATDPDVGRGMNLISDRGKSRGCREN
jgi:hypothetical protein